MPKQKTHKGMKKRVRITASGKFKFRQVGRGHLLSHKSGNRKRKLRRPGVLAKAESKKTTRLVLGQR